MKNTNYNQSKNYLFGFIQFALAMIFLTVTANAATYTVTTANDGLGIPGSLREAINQANATSDATFFININIGAGGVKMITLNSPLPAINPANATTVVIDGTTMSGYAGAPLVQLNGAFAGAGANGLTVLGGNVTVRGLVISNFSNYGIYMGCPPGSGNGCLGMSNLNVYGCYIGTDASGTAAAGNANGIRVQANDYLSPAVFTTNIGGTAANQRNVISGNAQNGIVFDSPFSDNDINVVNNHIGTNAAGTAAVPNGADGIFVFDTLPAGITLTPKVNIGGANAVQRNVISGNAGNGIRALNHNTLHIYIRGNHIGTNAAGTGDLGNGANGILADSSTGGSSFHDFYVGGTAAGEGNTISGNGADGIRNELLAMNIEGNRIGTNAAGTAAVANSRYGIFTADTMSIGNSTAGAGNTISGNGNDGIFVSSNLTSSVIVWGNRIGTNQTGTAILPNGDNGITILGDEVTVGGASAGVKNIIGGNTGHGILIQNSSEIYGNYIGTNASGADLGNGGDGVRLSTIVEDVEIGTTAAGEGNTIAFNDGDGIGLVPGFGASVPDKIDMRGNSIYSNSGLGIDLGPIDGVTANDLNDADAGANGLQNFPVLQVASGNFIQGTLNSEANKYYEIDFYRVDSCDASGNGEGRYYLGSKSVQTDAGGNANFNANGFSLAAGQFITATASKSAGITQYSTSEFSPCLTVSPPPGEVKLSSATYSANESNSSVAIIVSRTGGSNGTITVGYSASGGTALAGQDYTQTSGTLTFLHGETGKLVTIPILNDTTDEPDETLNFTLSNPTNGAQLINPSTAVITITDNDNPPIVSVNDVSVLEGNENLTAFALSVSLSEASAFATSVNWTTANGTANATADYQTNGGTVNFAAGETTKQITVQVIGELLVELNETFNVNLSAPTLLTIGDGNGVGTILDDDNPGKLSFSLAPYSGTEGNSVTVTVSRTSGTAGTISVDYATGGGTAAPFADYTPASGSLIFANGETTKTFTVDLLDDAGVEPTENFNVVLSNPVGGATLGAPSTAAINILDDDSGTLHTIGGEIKKPDNSPLAGATVNLTGTQTATATTDAQGKFAFSNLAPNGNYAITPQAIGFTFNPLNRQYNNLSADITNANFTATPAPSRQLRIVGGNATPGQNITATVELVAQGDENSVGFSLNFDHTVLMNPTVALGANALAANLIVNNSQAGAGKLGVLLAMPAGQSFAAGTKSLVVVTFNTMATNLYNSPVTFGSVPVGKQVVNSNADPLPVNYLDGSVTFAQGWEADVTPRPMGKNNGSITVTDFTQVGRFVAGLDAPNSLHNEFQRADCAPRISLGNGALDVADFTQAGRYAAAIDAVTSTGGQMAPRMLEFNNKGRLTVESLASLYIGNPNSPADSPDSAPTVVRVVNAQASPGSQVFVSIETVAGGTENGFGFTLNYDPNKLSSPLVTKGADTLTATLIPNTTQAGKVGVVMAMPFNEAVPAGTRQLVTVRFNVSPNAPGGLTALTFSDAPVIQAVSDVNANTMQSIFQDGEVNILGPTAAAVSVGGRVRTIGGKGVRNALITVTFPGGETRTALSGANGKYLFEDIPAGETYIITVAAKHYAFSQSSQIRQITEDVLDIDFVADLPGLTSTFTPR